MTRFQTFLAAAAAFFAIPAFAHDGVHVTDAYARTTGGMGANGAVFFVVQNHALKDDRLIDASTDVAEMAQLHTHKADANGVMQMMHVPEGFVIPAEGEHALARGGDHVMLMGLKRDLKDGDTVSLTLTFEHSGEVVVEVPVDNARKDMGGMTHMKHGAMSVPDTTGMADAEAITAVMMAQFDRPDAPLAVDPVVVQGDHALASWAQGDKGGRALLARRDGQWQIVLCGGADLRLPAFLTEHGVTAADTLSSLYNAAEDGLGAEKVALSSSFEGVVMISEPAKSE